jgi:hypothetical protein
LALDETLDKLAALDARKAELVKIRFFAGLSLSQAAEAPGISESTADADWAYAKAWLRRQIARSVGRKTHRPDEIGRRADGNYSVMRSAPVTQDDRRRLKCRLISRAKPSAVS